MKFKEFLYKKYISDMNPLDDDMEDGFYRWIDNLEKGSLMKYAEHFEECHKETGFDPATFDQGFGLLAVQKSLSGKDKMSPNMNKQNIELLKKEFEETFPYLFSSCDGREGYDAEVTQNVWNFFLPHLISSDEIKREVLEGFVDFLIEMETDWGGDPDERWIEHTGGGLKDLAKVFLSRDKAVGVLAKGNQSGNATREGGVFFQPPNSSGLISAEKQRLYDLFVEWLDAMGWLGEFTSGQETAIFEWFDNNYLTQSKEGGE